jgi:hypothetical protein
MNAGTDFHTPQELWYPSEIRLRVAICNQKNEELIMIRDV